MANLIRSAKSGSDWSTNELLAYNIIVKPQDVINFFGHELGSIDHLDSNLFSSADPTIAVDFSQETYRFLTYLHLASRPNAGQESAINDLARSVLEVTGFDQRGTILRTRYDIPFTICGDHRAARSDVCLVHLNSMILLVVQDKFSPSDPEPQIVAEAIATFQHNNRKRADLNLPQLDMMTIPCITMVGTRPFFYKIPVTQQLSDCVATGQFSSQPTIVVLRLPDERPLKAWKSQIIGASPYSTTMHSVVWRKIAGLRSLMAATKVGEDESAAMKPGQLFYYLVCCVVLKCNVRTQSSNGNFKLRGR